MNKFTLRAISALTAGCLTVLSARAVQASEPQPVLPAQTGLDFHLTPAQIASTCEAAINAAKQRIAQIEATPQAQWTFAGAMAPIESAEAELNDSTATQTVLYQISPDKKVRDASTACAEKVSNYNVQLSADPQIYAIAAHAQNSGAAAGEADRKLVEEYIEYGRRSGAALSAEQRAQTTALFTRLNNLQRDFAIALAGDASTVSLSNAQAAGLPAQFVAVLKKTTAGYIVPVNESTYAQFMSNERDARARYLYYVAYNRRGGLKNVARLEEAVGLRDQLAHMLGFGTWADYQLDAKMAKRADRVMPFLSQIDQTLLPKARQEEATLAALKRRQGDKTAFQPWDAAYYSNQLVKTRYAVDEQVVRRYFPVDHVVSSVLGIYQRLLGVTFTEFAQPDVWAPNVREFAITDSAGARPIGWFYLDLFPRPAKYSHFAAFPLRPGRLLADGSYQKPVAAIIGNWPLPAPGKQALLSHGDVITFFHEFGHIMHETLSTAPYETLYGVNVRGDFVEAPSQMLENWMWQPSVLKQVSRNVDSGRPLPDALIAKMIALKHVGEGLSWTRQAFLAMYDMQLHSSGAKVDATRRWADLVAAMTPYAMVPHTYPEASFGHLMGGYDAGYYGYLWSRVYAQDMFTRFERGGLENPEVGIAYRRDILEPGATREPDQLVEQFLGRPLSYDAFYRDLGIRH
jgi:thimet oligopeptidase